MQVAAGQGHLEVVAIMLDNSRSQTGKGLTALHLAVTQGREPLVADLLKLPSVAVDAKDSDGLTALHWAASKGAACCSCCCRPPCAAALPSMRPNHAQGKLPPHVYLMLACLLLVAELSACDLETSMLCMVACNLLGACWQGA